MRFKRIMSDTLYLCKVPNRRKRVSVYDAGTKHGQLGFMKLGTISFMSFKAISWKLSGITSHHSIPKYLGNHRSTGNGKYFSVPFDNCLLFKIQLFYFRVAVH